MNSKKPRAPQRRAPARPSKPLGEHIAEFQKNLSKRFKEGQRQQQLRRQRQQRSRSNPAAEQQWFVLRQALQFTWLQRRLRPRQQNQQPSRPFAAWFWPRTAATLTTRDAAALVLRSAAGALLLVTLITLVISAVPLKITTANWYLEILALIGESIPVLVLISVFALLSLTLDSENQANAAYRRKLLRFSRFGYILALLLLPVQLSLMAWLYGDAFNTSRIQRSAIVSSADALIVGAQNASTIEQFVAYLRSRNLNINLQSIGAAPLVQVRTEFIRSVKAQQQKQEQALNENVRSTVLRYTANGLRLLASLTILAVFLRGFQALVSRCSSQSLSTAQPPELPPGPAEPSASITSTPATSEPI